MESVLSTKSPLKPINEDSELYGSFRIRGLFLRAVIASIWALESLFYQNTAKLTLTHLAQAALPLAIAILVPRLTISAWASEAAVALGHLVWNTVAIWGMTLFPTLGEAETYLFRSRFCLILMMEIMCFGLRAELKLACTIAHLVSTAACVAVAITWDEAHVPVECVATRIGKGVVLFVVAFEVWMRHLKLWSILTAEQRATMALVKMMSDAGFWVDGDGLIERCDMHLDAIMGRPMQGHSLKGYLAHSDQELLQEAVKAPQGTAQLLPVTISPPGATPFNAELFVVAATGGFHSCFLIGLRLTEAMEVEASEARGHALWPAKGGTSRRSRCSRHSTSWHCSPCNIVSEGLSNTDGELEAPESPPEVQDLEAQSYASYPATLASFKREPLQVRTCRREHVVDAMLSGMATQSQQLRETVGDAVALCCDHAKGGALLLIAEQRAFASVFSDTCDMISGSITTGATRGPALETSDNGYMTARLRGLHITDRKFVTAFKDFTEHSSSDRWPEDYPDVAARSLPKDGAILLDTRGFRLKCSAKVLGLTPPTSWPGVGTRHGAALACTWAVKDCIALVRSDSGRVHGIVRAGEKLHAYCILPERPVGQVLSL